MKRPKRTRATTVRVLEGGGRVTQRRTTDRNKPFIAMSRHEFERAMDDMQRAPDSLAATYSA